MPVPPIRLLLAETHFITRAGLAAVLAMEGDVAIAAEAENAVEAVEKYRRTKPDIALVDLRMPVISGFETLRRLREEWPDARVLVFTTSEMDVDIRQAMDLGASGYLLKSVSREELITAIREVHAGRQWMPAEIAVRLAESQRRRQLTMRESEVLDFLRRGLSNRDIGAALGVSENTAKAHVRSILHKLESADRAEAVSTAYECGLLRTQCPA